ncbi:MAG TPA: hypothetical protein VNJ12_13635 [Candidatus Dormibacteraeota bacterium]|nr:hypothetical protein [Candidatus Dormibacteraeota bacterium]
MRRLPSCVIPIAAALTLGLALAPFALAAGSAPSPSQASIPGYSSSTLEVGDVIPSFRAADQFGNQRDFANLEGARGLLILFFRSADW